MNILGRLALWQVRRKKSRTVMTVLAMILSSALLTAVVNFVASGNAMLVAFLGEDYGAYGGAYTLLLLIPGAVLGLLIVTMSVTVISNVFRMSASERISEFGTLKCVGATGEQIYRTIMYECLFLCAAAIPVGVLLGYLLSFLGIRVANGYMDELNVLTRAMMMSVRFELSFVFSPVALFVSVLVSVGTVALSAMGPARKAMKIPALECIRNGGEGGERDYDRRKNAKDTRGCGSRRKSAADRIRKPDRRRQSLLDGKGRVEYRLARKNVASHNRKMKSAVRAFSLSILLFVTMSGLKEIADGVMAYISHDYGYTVMADYTSNYTYRINEETGRGEHLCVQTIDDELAEKIRAELAAYGDTKVYGTGQDYFSRDALLREEEITGEMREAWDYLAPEENEAPERTDGETKIPVGEEALYRLPVERIIVDKEHYRELCEQAGVKYGGTILVNDYRYNDHGTERHIAALKSSTVLLQLEREDGSTEQVRIDGVLLGEDVPKELDYPNENPVRLILPEGEVRGYNWMASPADEEGYMAHAKAVLEKYFPQGGKEYGEAGFVSRVFGAEDFAKIMNIAIVLAFFFLYAFVFLLGLIGLLNVMSTEMFQVKMRAREFAVLKSVGMTSKDLEGMLNLESALCAGKALAVGLPAGILVIWFMKWCVQKIVPVPFRIPWGTIAGVILAAFVLMWGTLRVSLRALKEQNLIETIRM